MTEVVLSAGDTAWVLASSALVLLMTPGLALFYGGMVRSKSVLNMMMMSLISIGIVSVFMGHLWLQISFWLRSRLTLVRRAFAKWPWWFS